MEPGLRIITPTFMGSCGSALHLFSGEEGDSGWFKKRKRKEKTKKVHAPRKKKVLDSRSMLIW